MNYDELKKIAKSLNIKISGKKKAELEAEVKAELAKLEDVAKTKAAENMEIAAREELKAPKVEEKKEEPKGKFMGYHPITGVPIHR